MSAMDEKRFYQQFPETYKRTLDAPEWAREIDNVRLTVGQVNYFAALINKHENIFDASAEFRESHYINQSGCCLKKWKLGSV